MEHITKHDVQKFKALLEAGLEKGKDRSLDASCSYSQSMQGGTLVFLEFTFKIANADLEEIFPPLHGNKGEE